MIVAPALLAALPPAFAADDPASVGRAMFEGRAELRGKIRGHASALPVQASRCSNCHLQAEPGVAVGAGASAPRPTQTFGPVLTPTHLTGLRSRRGAPASRYDLASFCSLLRTGIDPSKVVLSRTMPLYEIDDRGCEALWAHLTRGRP